MTTSEYNKLDEIANEIYERGYDDGLKSAERIMKPERAYEIEKSVFSYEIEIMRHLDCSCDSTAVKFLIGKYIGMMKKTLQEELQKEINRRDEK